jgi:hypothetical protein
MLGNSLELGSWCLELSESAPYSPKHFGPRSGVENKRRFSEGILLANLPVHVDGESQTMIEDRIRKIEARLEESPNIPAESKAELLKLLASLKDEVSGLDQSHEEDARSLAGFVDTSAYEVTRSERKPKQVEASLTGLKASVESFEASHPKLAEVVNQIATVLSNMGL